MSSLVTPKKSTELVYQKRPIYFGTSQESSVELKINLFNWHIEVGFQNRGKDFMRPSNPAEIRLRR